MVDIAILGLGIVGGGTAEALDMNAAIIQKRAGDGINIKYICDLRSFPDSPYADRVVSDFNIILNDPAVKVVVETIGGSRAAYEFTKKALEAGKHVVTSNKELVARHGAELLAAAAAHGVRYMFEASVGGGVPIIKPLLSDLAANDVLEINGILNGTTNYILSRMSSDGVDFNTALDAARELGYAEADPTDDVEGIDACRKICILAAIAFGKMTETAGVYTEGITKIRAEDVVNIGIAGYSAKLIARAARSDGKMMLSVVPMLVSAGNPLSMVGGVNNAILVNGNLTGSVMFYGRGAGALPTASAVLSDIIDVCANPSVGAAAAWSAALPEDLGDFGTYRCRNYYSFAGERGLTVPKIIGIFGDVRFIDTYNGEIAFIAGETGEVKSAARLEEAARAGLRLLSRIRVLN